MTNLKLAAIREKETLGLTRSKGPADALHEIAAILTFTEQAMISANESGDVGEGLFVDDSLEGLILMTRACHTEINRIAKVTPAFAPDLDAK